MIKYTAFENDDDWLNFRIDYFTSSEIHRLMTTPKSKSESLSVGAKTYVMEKVAEKLAIPEPQHYNSDMERGNEFEPKAALKVAEYLGKSVDDDDFIYTSVGGKIFLYDDELGLGGTPDIIIRNQMDVELKCPRSKTHLEYLMITDQEQLKSVIPKYYGQMQSNMYLSGNRKSMFGSFDDRFYNEKLHFHNLMIEYDSDYANLMIEKLGYAKELKDKMIKKLA